MREILLRVLDAGFAIGVLFGAAVVWGFVLGIW